MKRSVPISQSLHLDVRKLPAIIFQPIQQRGKKLANVQERSDQAWENFGKPGRDPSNLQGVLAIIASDDQWKQQLLIAKLRSSWQQVIGNDNAKHCVIRDIRDNVLFIQAESAVWANNFSFLLPQIKEKITQQLLGITIRDIRIIGPTSNRLRSTMFSRQ